MKRILIFTILIIITFIGYWFIFQKNWNNNTPKNPPTAEELRRIEEIEKSSSKIAPDAVAGAGVRPVGSLPKNPPKPPVETESTTTEKIE